MGLPDKALAFQFSELDVDIALHEFLFALTYGFTDDLEATIAVPLEDSDLALAGSLAAVGVRAADGSVVAAEERVEDRSDLVGVGDVLLRAKYRFLGGGPVRLAGSLLLRLPTGDEDDFQGVGFLEVAPGLLVSTRSFEPASWARLQGHLNASVGLDTEDVDASEARWGIGVDWGITEGLTAAVGVLGRHQFARVAPPGFFDFPRSATLSATAAPAPHRAAGRCAGGCPPTPT
jgi:hypothetical protein